MEKAKKFRENFLLDKNAQQKLLAQKQIQIIGNLSNLRPKTALNQNQAMNLDQNIQLALREISPPKVQKQKLKEISSQFPMNMSYQNQGERNSRSRSPELSHNIQSWTKDTLQINNSEANIIDPSISVQVDPTQSLTKWLQNQPIDTFNVNQSVQNYYVQQPPQIITTMPRSQLNQSQLARQTYSPISTSKQKIKEIKEENENLLEQVKQLNNQIKSFKQKNQICQKEISRLKEENEEIKNTSADQIQRFEKVLHRFQAIDIDYQNEKNDNEQLRFDLNESKVQLDMAKAHLSSVIQVMSDVLEYVITRCQIAQPAPSVTHSRNQSQSQHNFDQTQLSNSTDFMDRSYDDERRNLIEQIKSILIAKIDSINKTVIGLDFQRELNNIRNWRIIEPPTQQLHISSYDTNHNSATSRKDTNGNLFTQQQHYSRNTFTNLNLNSNNTVNFLGMGGSLYNGTLGAQSNSSKKFESDATPVPSFGKISARDERSSKFNMDKGGSKKKSTKTQNKEILNNDSMMNINPFLPSDMHSKISYDNNKSHSSMSKDGRDIVFTMKESIRDLDSFNLTPEKITQNMHQTFSQSFSPTLDHRLVSQKEHQLAMTNNIKLNLMNDQLSSIDVDFVDEFQLNNNQDSIHKRNLPGSVNYNYHQDYLGKPRVQQSSLNNLRHSKNIHSQDNLQGSFGPQAEATENQLTFQQEFAIGLQSHKSQDMVKQQNLLSLDQIDEIKYGGGDQSSISLGSLSFKDNILSTSNQKIAYQPMDNSVSDGRGINMLAAKALYEFKAQKDKDLSFNVGDEILIEKKRSNGWWIGYCNGKKGYFPHNYVQIENENNSGHNNFNNIIEEDDQFQRKNTISESLGGLGFNSSFNDL
ncbi:variant sh3 domain containing protein [Stylonychia lemnae]|uniref:Variant sh3 domain containing protein n=1 Tax=Stylonychia lemnae TaxID=5949 RepID=A0A078B702_STYLE|nr:variant sh3 domain containing protein [Stylonychia lemnae]|eukprot:CDW89343.1 variant sh3 domain containing protein [Stylonychia lemnae]